MSPAQLNPSLADLARHVTECALCRGRAAVIGLFLPDDQPHAAQVCLEDRGITPPAPGRLRVLAYGLCLRCAAGPDALARVERVLGWGGGRG